jgi:quercetin dioxygenase-like cupin family protein
MYSKNIIDIESNEVDMEGAKNSYIQWLITKKDGANNFALRRFVLKKGGYIPPHQHPWEHEIYILKGKGTVAAGNVQKDLKEGDFAYIEPDVVHWYKNNDDTEWIFLCAIPYKE